MWADDTPEFWVCLIEKALAKVFEDYEALISYDNSSGIHYLTGFPVLIRSSEDYSKLNYWRKIVRWHQKEWIITCACQS